MTNQSTNRDPKRFEYVALIETALTGLFFVQALRFVIGMLYSRVASASLVSAYPIGSIPTGTLGVVDPSAVSIEISLLGLVIALPLITLLLGRVRFVFIVAGILVAAGRALMNIENAPITSTLAAEMVVGGGLLYIALLIRNRAKFLPYFFLLGLAGDQLFRAYGNTQDPSWMPLYANIQLGLSALLIVVCLFLALPNREKQWSTRENRGLLTFWGAISLGAMLYLQLALLALPNAVAARADADYTLFVPALLVATLLPIVPFVRRQARTLMSPFDVGLRGWVWLIALVFFIIVGLRLQRLGIGTFEVSIGGAALVIAQLMVSLLWWWLTEPQGERKYNLSGLWLLFTILIFGLLFVGDLFTYEYAFVRNFAPPLEFLNPIIPPLLRGFREMGLVLILFALFLALMPMIQTTQRVPWAGRNNGLLSFFALLFTAGCAIVGGYFARPPLIQPILNVTEIRVGTYNIHGGFSEFFAYDLEGTASAIERSGAAVVLLQEVEAGRLTSFGVDQTLWLARRLGMDRRFFPTIEGLHGLAVLSRVPIVFDDGILIPGVDRTTGLQRVQIRPDESVVTLYNTSLGFLLQGNSLDEQESNQLEQLNILLATINNHVEIDYGGQLGRTIIGGTFNNVPDSPLIQLLTKTGFSDPFAGTNVDLTATLVRVDRKARVDYLWLWSPLLDSIGSGVIDSPASDHRLAFASVNIRGR